MDWQYWVQVAGGVVLGASALLKVLAPLTKTKWDNKVLKALTWVTSKVSLNTNLEK